MDNDNESGLAYSMVMIVLFLFVAPVIWLAWAWVINLILTGTINPIITGGQDMSMQTRNGIAFGVDFLRYGIPAILIGAVAYAVNQANVKKGGG